MSLTKNRIFYNLNMSFFDYRNIFDYKLLLILGLALVLFYIYYEIEYMNEKIDILSETIYSLKKKDANNETVMINNNTTTDNHKINDNNSNTNDKQESITSSDSNLQSSNLESNNSQSNNLQSNMDSDDIDHDNIDNNNPQNDSESDSHSDIISNAIINIDINDKMDNEKHEYYESNENSIKHIEIYSNSTPISTQKFDINKVSNITEADLKKLNISDIKKKADELNITTTKMIDGKSKVKTKNELIKEILEK